VLSVVQQEWGLSATAAGSISSAYPVGTAVALVVVSMLANYLNPRPLVFRVSAGLTAVVALLIPVLAQGLVSALLLFGAVAVARRRHPTPGIMLLAERFEPARRGRAPWAGSSQASSTGYVVALLVGGTVVERAGWRTALFVLALGPLLCFFLSIVLFHGDRSRRIAAHGPRRLSFEADLSGNRPAQLMIAGYVFHSWELLGMWAWTPAFIAAALAVHGLALRRCGLSASLSALFHVMGILASTVGGALSDRWGRRRHRGDDARRQRLSFLRRCWRHPPLIVIVGVYGFSALGSSGILQGSPRPTGPLGSAPRCAHCELGGSRCRSFSAGARPLRRAERVSDRLGLGVLDPGRGRCARSALDALAPHHARGAKTGGRETLDQEAPWLPCSSS
jgi:MFS family permease